MNEFEGIKLLSSETLLRITGRGDATVTPDTVTIFISVVTTASHVREATDANVGTMTRVIDAIQAGGANKRDIRTHQVRVVPQFDRSQNQISGYEVRNGVTVQIRDPEAASSVIAAAFEAGANAVEGPVFGTADPQAGIREARAAALADASSKAEACAAGLGLRISRVLSVNEGSLSDTREQARHYRSASGSSGPPIEEGELRRSLNIAVSYALTP